MTPKRQPVKPTAYATSPSVADLDSFEFDFRKSRWGMTHDMVRRSELLIPVYDGDEGFVYKGSVGGFECNIIYFLTDSVLTHSKYQFTGRHTNKIDFISDYSVVKDQLTKKYGMPVTDRTIWKNDLYRNDFENWGFAITLGHLVYLSSWETNTTEISLFLTGDNFDADFYCLYTSKAHSGLRNNSKKDSGF